MPTFGLKYVVGPTLGCSELRLLELVLVLVAQADAEVVGDGGQRYSVVFP